MKRRNEIAQSVVSAGLGLTLALGSLCPAYAAEVGQNAQNMPTGEYADAQYDTLTSNDQTSGGTTNLYIAKRTDDFTAPEGTVGAQMKVSIPVAIHYVADADGNLVGPSDNTVMIVNHTKLGPVHVSGIQVKPTTGLSLVNYKDKMNKNEISLFVEPVAGTLDQTETEFVATHTGGLDQLSSYVKGSVSDPVNRYDWDIASENGALALNHLKGRMGSSNLISQAADQQVGAINWTIRLGTRDEAEQRDAKTTLHYNFNGGKPTVVGASLDQVVELKTKNESGSYDDVPNVETTALAFSAENVTPPDSVLNADGSTTSWKFDGWYLSNDSDKDKVERLNDVGSTSELYGTTHQLYAHYTKETTYPSTSGSQG